MFDTYRVESQGFSPAVFLAQFIGAPLGGLILGALAYLLIEALFRLKDSTLLGYLIFSVQGFVLGYNVQIAFPRAIESWGRWMWIPPLGNLAFWTLLELQRGPQSQAAAFFSFPSTHGSDEGIVLFLITWPAVASCFYSLGIHVASKPPRSSWGKRLRRAVTRENSNNNDEAEPTAACNR